MANPEVNTEDWRRLFEAAIKFKRQGCWEWMSDEDYFAITDPETGEMGYCVVLGAGGMEYGLNVYRGRDAAIYLNEIRDIFALSNDDSQELMLSTNAVTVGFEDRGALDKADLDLIRRLGYKFRGSGEWPMFRSYEPGVAPWFLNGQEVRFLTAALEQTIEVAERFRRNHELYFEHDEQDDGFGEKRLHRVPHKTAAGIVWEDEWLPWKPEGSLIEPYTYPDELRLQQLKRSLKKSKDVWQSDFEYAPVAVGGRGERPSYPRFCLWVDQKTGMIMDVKLVEQRDCRERYVEQFLLLLERTKQKPERVEVGSSKAAFALMAAAEKLGIPVQVNPMLDELFEAKEAILSSL